MGYREESEAAGKEKAVSYREERIWAWTLAPESALQILEITLPYYEKELLAYETFVEGTAYATEDYVNQPTKYGAPSRAIHYVQKTRIPVEDFPGFVRAHAHELDSLDMIIPGRDIFHQVREQLRENVDGIYMTSSMERMLEVSHKDGGKGSGLRFILKELGCDAANAIAFGDGNNDADMLAHAGVGIAVANATPLCLENADFITASNDDFGVAQVLEWLVQTNL